jgi:hypothetical protein
VKKDKDEVDYSRGMWESHCGPVFLNDKNYCKHFVPGSGPIYGTCEVVNGAIDPIMWCKEYKRKPRR